MRESKIESGNQGWRGFGVGPQERGERGECFIGRIPPPAAVRELGKAKEIHGGRRIGGRLGAIVGFARRAKDRSIGGIRVKIAALWRILE